MRFLFDVGHPAQVHLIKNLVRTLSDHHEVLVCAREREGMVEALLDEYGIPNVPIGRTHSRFAAKIFTMPLKITQLLHKAAGFQPDLIFSTGSPYASYTSMILRVPHVMFLDSDPLGAMNIQSIQTLPFATCVLTPHRFDGNWSKRMIKIDSYKELAYLHPNWWKPEFPGRWLGLQEGEPYALLRFGSFDASHDIGIAGFSEWGKKELVREIGKHMAVFISSEEPLGPPLDRYRLKSPYAAMHDVLACARLVVCDTQTTATEAACLGVPVIRYNGWVLKGDLTNFRELEELGLVTNAKSEREAVEEAALQARSPPLAQRRVAMRKMLERKIDLTHFLIWFFENWPTSMRAIMHQPEIQYTFLGKSQSEKGVATKDVFHDGTMVEVMP